MQSIAEVTGSQSVQLLPTVEEDGEAWTAACNLARSLRETLTVWCSERFEEVFFRSVPGGAEPILNESISFRSNFFERFLAAGRGLGAYVKPRLLRRCLAYRRPLNWREVDLSCTGTLADGLLTADDLRNAVKDDFPLRKFSFCTSDVTETMLLHLSRVSSHLEHLDVGPDEAVGGGGRAWRPRASTGRLKQLYRTKVKMPRLEFLKLSFDNFSVALLDAIDLDSSRASLRVLKLHGFGRRPDPHYPVDDLGRSSALLIDFVRGCENLLTLSLVNSRFDEVGSLFEAIASLPELRSLDFRGLCARHLFQEHGVDLSRLIAEGSPNLANLEVGFCSLPAGDVDSIAGRYFDYLGRYETEDEEVSSLEARVVAGGETVEGLLNALLALDDRCALCRIVTELLDRVDDVSHLSWRCWRKFSWGLSRCLDAHPYDRNLLMSVKRAVERTDCWPHWQTEFRAKMIRHYAYVYPDLVSDEMASFDFD